MSLGGKHDRQELLLTELGQKELALQELIAALPAEIRRSADSGDNEAADRLEQDLQQARLLLATLRKRIAVVEAKLYPSRTRR